MQVSACGPQPQQELADELAATTGEVMIELADLGHDEAVRGAMEDARRLREIARTLSPDPARLAQSGAALTATLRSSCASTDAPPEQTCFAEGRILTGK